MKIAMMCKLMHCRPSELRNEDYEELELVTHVFDALLSKNPMIMFS